MARVTMLFGEVGAGKTTLAREIESHGAVRFSLDEWTIAAGGSRVVVDWQVVERMLAQLMRSHMPVMPYATARRSASAVPNGHMSDVCARWPPERTDQPGR